MRLVMQALGCWCCSDVSVAMAGCWQRCTKYTNTFQDVSFISNRSCADSFMLILSTQAHAHQFRRPHITLATSPKHLSPLPVSQDSSKSCIQSTRNNNVVVAASSSQTAAVPAAAAATYINYKAYLFLRKEPTRAHSPAQAGKS